MYTFRMKRQQTPTSRPYWQDIAYDGSGDDSVATALQAINADLAAKGEAPIQWQCSCMVRKCGACAMVIDGLPRLACSTFLRTLPPVITVTPLQKFPIVCDLVVDRSVIHDMMKELCLWRTDDAHPTRWTQALHVQSSRCLLCGCCLEICPNFDGTTTFAGAIAPVNTYRILDGTANQDAAPITQAYRQHYYRHCGLSLSCHHICPAHIPIEALIAHSNANALWRK